MKQRILSVSTILLSVALILLIMAMSFSASAFGDLSYARDAKLTAFGIIAIWLVVGLVLNNIFFGDNPSWETIVHAFAIFFAVMALGRHLIGALTPLAIYFTVAMGDTETYAIATPKLILAIVWFILAVICIIVASGFFVRQGKTNNQKTVRGGESA